MREIPPAQRIKESPFFIFDRRAMISLGPLSSKKYCTFSCPFCYVHSGFLSYASMTVDEIIAWLKSKAADFDVVYVSGDTDSFARPRTDEGLHLLVALAELQKDVLFTTRAIFDANHLEQLRRVNCTILDHGRTLIGCVSVAQYTKPQLEPPPIAHPDQRIAQLKQFADLGLRTILAIRPFLPPVPPSDYDQIIDETGSAADVVIGEAWYADKGGILEAKMAVAVEMPRIQFSEHHMDFDDNGQAWKVFEAKEIEAYVKSKCDSLELPFFMRSTPAVKWIKDHPRK